MNYNTAITILHIKHGATKEEIKKAFLALARIHHPDKGGEAKKFVEINNAYEYLMKNDAPSFTQKTYDSSYGYGYSARRWWNPATGEFEDLPPTTGKTSSRTKVDDTMYQDYWIKKKEKEIQVQKLKMEIFKLEQELREKRGQLLHLELSMGLGDYKQYE